MGNRKKKREDRLYQTLRNNRRQKYQDRAAEALRSMGDRKMQAMLDENKVKES